MQSQQTLSNLQAFSLVQQDSLNIEIFVVNPTEVKSTLSNYTIYTLKGNDKQGQFQVIKRYSDFDHIRAYLLNRWPGCFIPPLPRKKRIGNNDNIFVEVRRQGLQTFCQQIAILKHLWYSIQFQTFLRRPGQVEKNLKALPHERVQQIIKKYENTLINLGGKSVDTLILGKVVNFCSYLKKVLPLLTNYKQTLQLYIEARSASNQQYGILLNFLLPEFEKNCLSQYVNHNTQGKFILADSNNEKLAQCIAKLKKLFAKTDFQHLFWTIDLEQRQIEAFLDSYKVMEAYDVKLKELNAKQKQLLLEQQKLMAGKQGLFKSILKKNIEDQKKEVQRSIENVKQDVKNHTYLNELMSLILGAFEIQRFKKLKVLKYYESIRNISILEQQLSSIRSQLYDHLLQNHNLI